MTDKGDLLLDKVRAVANDQKKQAKNHKRMHRNFWLLSAIISVAIAIFSAFDVPMLFIQSKNMATVLALILPFVTGYVVLRSPEKLWIFEVNTRNQLFDLATEIELLMDRKENFDRAPFEKKYLAIMEEANKKWVELASH